MRFVSNRDITVGGTQGYAIEFKKGVPQEVPKRMWEECMNKGILPEDDLPEEAAAPIGTVPDDEAVVEARILDAFKTIVARQQRGDFTGSGYPSVAAVSQLVGFPADRKMVAPIWEKHRNVLTAESKQ